MPINTAKLKERLEFQQQTIPPGSYDFPESGWTTVAIIKGQKIKQKGELLEKSYGEFYVDMTWINCRYSNIPQKGMRVLYNGSIYTVMWLEVMPTVPKNLTIGLKLVS